MSGDRGGEKGRVTGREWAEEARKERQIAFRGVKYFKEVRVRELVRA